MIPLNTNGIAFIKVYRWARLNAPGQPLVAGYRAGAAKLQQFVEWCDDIGIPVITLWVLSTDNLDRFAADELEPLLEVIDELVVKLADTGRWRVQAVGDLDLLPKEPPLLYRVNFVACICTFKEIH